MFAVAVIEASPGRALDVMGAEPAELGSAAPPAVGAVATRWPVHRLRAVERRGGVASASAAMPSAGVGLPRPVVNHRVGGPERHGPVGSASVAMPPVPVGVLRQVVNHHCPVREPGGPVQSASAAMPSLNVGLSRQAVRLGAPERHGLLGSASAAMPPVRIGVPRRGVHHRLGGLERRRAAGFPAERRT